MLAFFILLHAVVVSYATASTTLYHISEHIDPISYVLSLKIDTSALNTYSGTVKIKFKLSQAQNIELNVNENLIVREDVKVYNATDGDVLDFTKTYDQDSQRFIITLKEFVYSEQIFTIDIPFSGEITNQLGWVKVENNGKYFIASNFKRNLAHNVFPCFDYPQMRAKFRVIIERKDNAITFSNSKLHESKLSSENEGWKLDIYEDTPSMAPYQISLAVTDMTDLKLCNFFKNDFRITVWVQNKFEERGNRLAMLIGGILDDLNLPNIKDSLLTKMDYILVPDPTSLSVETMGLIMKSEVDAFKEHDYGENDYKYFVSESLAKLWFGVAVSPKSWKTQWLLTCLAKYISLHKIDENYLTAKIFPQRFPVMGWDSNIGIKKMEDIIETNGNLEQEDPPQKLAKGLQLIFMIEGIFGRKHFVDAVVKFATQHVENQALVDSDSFWEHMDGSSVYIKNKPSKEVKLYPEGVNTKTIMESWTKQAVYPLLFVKRFQDTKGKFEIEQTLFVSEPAFRTPTSNADPTVPPKIGPCWLVPLSYTTENMKVGFKSTKPIRWLTCHSDAPTLITIDSPTDKWIILNNKMTGFYRVNYENQGWELIIEALNNPESFTKIHPFNRAQLVNDVLTFSSIDFMGFDLDIACRLVAYLRHETKEDSLIVWEAFFDGIDRVKETRVGLERIQDTLQEFLSIILAGVYKEMFPTKDSVLQYVKQEKISENFAVIWRIQSEGCHAKVPQCLTNLHDIFDEWKTSGFFHKPIESSYSKDLIKSVLCLAANGPRSVEVIEYIFQVAEELGIRNRNRIFFLGVLKCPRNAETIERVLDWSTSSSINEGKDEKFVTFMDILSKKDILPQVLAFYYTKAAEIQSYFSYTSNIPEPTYPIPGTPLFEIIDNAVREIACDINNNQLQKLILHLKGNTQLIETVKGELIQCMRDKDGNQPQNVDSFESALKAEITRLKATNVETTVEKV